MWLGIRPETLRLAGTNGNPGHGRIDGIAELGEPLGAETILSVAIGGQNRLVARTEGHVRLRPGERVQLEADVDKLHVFDRASELNIGLAPQ